MRGFSKNSRMVSVDSERISRLRRRYSRLAAGVDEDWDVIHGIIYSVHPRCATIAAAESEIRKQKEEIRKRRAFMQSRIDEMSAIRDELRRVTGKT